MLPSFRRTSPAALPKAGTPRCYERLTATDVDLGYVLEHGELPSWHPQQRSIWRLRRSPLLWWGRWRLRKAQMLQNGSGRFEVGNHGQDLAFPSTSGASEQLKPKGSFQQLRPRNSPALPPRPRSRASFGLSDNLHRGRSCCWSRWVLFDTGPLPPPPDATWRWAQRPHDSERHECQARESTAPAGR